MMKREEESEDQGLAVSQLMNLADLEKEMIAVGREVNGEMRLKPIQTNLPQEES